MQVVIDILSSYPHATVCKDVKSKNEVLRKHKTRHYVYVMVADNEIVVLGEGVNSRGNVIFSGYSAPAHMKAFVAAMAHNAAEEVSRIIIPVINKNEALAIESELMTQFTFFEMSVDAKNEKWLEKRANQLKMKIRENVKIALMPLIYATGTDMGTFKKYRIHLSSEVNDTINKLFGNYYKDFYS